MAISDEYDYSAMFPFIEEFRNPFSDRPFITEMEENYGSLWQLKNCVIGWTLGVSRHNGHVHLLHKEANSPAFLPLNVFEKVILLEQFHGQYIVIGIQAVTPKGSELQHVHSIVVKVGIGCTQFDVDGMLNSLRASDQVDSESRRLNQILQVLTRYSRPARSTSAAPRPGVTSIDASHVTASGSGVQASNSRSTARPTGRATPRVRSRIQEELPESSQKRQRSSAGAGSSGSGLTHVDNRGGGEIQDVPLYEKFTTTQKEFWESYSSSFIFGQQAYSVDIAQC
jgi:hypothetical protein